MLDPIYLAIYLKNTKRTINVPKCMSTNRGLVTKDLIFATRICYPNTRTTYNKWKIKCKDPKQQMQRKLTSFLTKVIEGFQALKSKK